jgi:hypothetical protein
MAFLAVTIGRGRTQHAARPGALHFYPGGARLPVTVCGQAWETELGAWPLDTPRRCEKCKRILK